MWSTCDRWASHSGQTALIRWRKLGFHHKTNLKYEKYLVHYWNPHFSQTLRMKFTWHPNIEIGGLTIFHFITLTVFFIFFYFMKFGQFCNSHHIQGWHWTIFNFRDHLDVVDHFQRPFVIKTKKIIFRSWLHQFTIIHFAACMICQLRWKDI